MASSQQWTGDRSVLRTDALSAGNFLLLLRRQESTQRVLKLMNEQVPFKRVAGQAVCGS
ncbi:MAG: hypothetical protein IT228_09935 [Flavobacteriales bacterium]|nr:hypothetical protein [Flavobacteriales bacterium]MCC6577647.1 hypothetical protein [Flavobacteriales bacterium]NUQ16612.1 hypothetical protein [Flavobacteriales bacterium]